MSPKCACAVAIYIALIVTGCQRKAAVKDDPTLSPLMNAAAQEDLPRVQQLIRSGADVNEHGKYGESVLYHSIECPTPACNNVPIIKALIQAGADVNRPDMFGVSPFDLSLSRDYGNEEASLVLLQAGTKIDQKCGKGDGEVSGAAQDGMARVVEALLNAGAPVNCSSNGDGSTALYFASLNGEAKIVKLLIAHGAKMPVVSKPPIQ